MDERVRTVRWLLVLKAVVWVVLAAGFVLTQRTRMEPDTRVIVGALLGVDAALYLFFGWAIGRLNHWIFVLALLFLAGNAVLTVTDEFGLFDLIVLLMDGVIAALLLTRWRLFFPAQS